MRTIAQRELRNHISQVLREVEAGEVVRITVDGRPVADLVPIGETRRTFVPRQRVLEIIGQSALDRGFERDSSILGATIRLFHYS
jgi:prevent-host-death family protein